MKLLLALTLIAAPSLAQAPAAPTANPIVWSANQLYARQSKFIVAAAEEMPADKLSFKPTPEQLTFGAILSHLATSNGSLCAMISGTPAPTTLKVTQPASKEDLVTALKASFDFCDTAMANLTDAQLSDIIAFRNSKVPRARALFELDVDLFDHYSQMAGYLRLSGLLPPSAAPRK
jgi:DinB superfamily